MKSTKEEPLLPLQIWIFNNTRARKTSEKKVFHFILHALLQNEKLTSQTRVFDGAHISPRAHIWTPEPFCTCPEGCPIRAPKLSPTFHLNIIPLI